MRDELDRALDDNPDYPLGFDPRWLEEPEVDVEPEEDEDELRKLNLERRTSK